jgi:hypothetical protein
MSELASESLSQGELASESLSQGELASETLLQSELARSAAREAAFGAGVQDVPRGLRDPELRWLAAVALGGQGRYAAAATELERLAAEPGVPARVAAHAAVTRAAHLRQLGGHAAARAHDARGLRLATAACRAEDDGVRAGPVDDGLDAPAARIDALVGLAADALGLGDPLTSLRLLDVAAVRVAAHPSWRPAVRAGWVRAELALMQGRAAEAVGPAEAALTGARGAGSVRHILKSRIVLVVAAGAAGALDAARAVAELDAIARECAGYGLLPLQWPAALAAADLQERINEQVPSVAGSSLGGRFNGATRRRHAARVALNDIECGSDPVGKRQMGESVWIPRSVTLM